MAVIPTEKPGSTLNVPGSGRSPVRRSRPQHSSSVHRLSAWRQRLFDDSGSANTTPGKQMLTSKPRDPYVGACVIVGQDLNARSLGFFVQVQGCGSVSGLLILRCCN